MTEVDLPGSRRARPFPEEERLWANDLKRLIQKIKTHTEDLKEVEKIPKGKRDLPENDSAPTLSLAIFGPAGSGKSSLLKTLVAEAKKRGKKMDGLQHVASLDVLQPARFGPDDHLLYATVAACLDAHIKPENENPEYEALSDVLKAYREVSGDLRVLHRENLPEGVDPHALAAEVVQRHTSALNLRQRLDEFFDHVADDLNDDVPKGEQPQSVVLLPVDDLDLNPEFLYQGLRELQGYLLHPRMVPVFCFTDRLAEEFLAAEYAKTLRHADVRRQRSGDLPVSEQLAVQHLAKCFPVRNRIRLSAAPAVLQDAVLKPKSGEASGEGEKMPDVARIRKTLEDATSLLFGVEDLDARHPVPAALRPSTLRRQFQVIESMGDAMNDKLVSAETRTWGTKFDRAAWALLNVHRDVLRGVGLQLEDLYGWTPHALRRVLLQALFQLSDPQQAGLWQRWRSQADSRRAQVISLLAANVHRPWWHGERPSGEDRGQMDAFNKARSGKEILEKPEHIEAPIALLWFLDLAVGFYLPFSRAASRYRLGTAEHAEEPLHGAGWSLRSAPILAALAADDDREPFPTGALFLDPFSYATALSTPPRIAACRVLDQLEHANTDESNLVKNAKIAFLSFRTDQMVRARIRSGKVIIARSKSGDNPELRETLNDLLTKFGDRERNWIDTTQTPNPFGVAIKRYKEVANWEIGESATGISGLSDQRVDHLKAREFRLALNLDKDPAKDNEVREVLTIDDFSGDTLEANEASNRQLIWGLRSAAHAVHDDQLLLRIWTCYGRNRGRFWAAVSLWRGLGLMGQLVEGHRRWQAELPREYRKKYPGNTKEDIEKRKRATSRGIEKRIRHLLHTHSLRGLVSGKDQGKPHGGSLELAFPSWNHPGQRDAIRRLAVRLRSWLDNNRKLSIDPAQGDKATWSGCFVRRLHGAYLAGSLWQWLDAEHLEHQGRQYGKRHRYYWNAGLALTSWMRVLQRYFHRAHEMRWMFETCPLASPFLSRTSADPMLEALNNKSYNAVLQWVAKDTQEWLEKGKPLDSLEMRQAERFRAITDKLQTLWNGGSDITKILSTPCTGDTRKDWRTMVDGVIKELTSPNIGQLTSTDEGDENGKPDVASGEDADVERLAAIARGAREAIWGKEPPGATCSESLTRFRDTLLKTFVPRVKDPAEKADGDKLDPTSARFEIASIIQQHWKVTAHASTAGLFYQLPRVSREDFFDQPDQPAHSSQAERAAKEAEGTTGGSEGTTGGSEGTTGEESDDSGTI